LWKEMKRKTLLPPLTTVERSGQRRRAATMLETIKPWRFLGIALLSFCLIPQPIYVDEPMQPDDIAVQLRGPVHEAYAQPVPSSPQASPVVPKQPPEPIPEQPPDQKPEGDNVQWIPGYWAWDVDRNDCLWVSGFWRNPPP